MSILHSLYRILCCPDDGASLKLHPGRMECTHCRREFAVEDNFVSLISEQPATLSVGSSYAPSYLQARTEAQNGGWRIFEGSTFTYKHRQVASVERILSNEGRDLVCDISAGPGYYSLTYARTWRSVIHCDLSLDTLREAQAQARRQGLDNILFVRMDYLRPPFRATLPSIICMDTLIRGPEHEHALLQAISASLAPDGIAVVDFHNWWHNPLRRLGLLPDNFTGNRSYTRRELSALLSSAGITRYESFPFHQEIPLDSPLSSIAAKGLPPTRWMYRFRHAD